VKHDVEVERMLRKMRDGRAATECPSCSSHDVVIVAPSFQPLSAKCNACGWYFRSKPFARRAARK